MPTPPIYIPDIPYLRDWMAYVDEQESPRIFHLWSALSCLSVCTGRRICIPQGFYTIYTNFYMALIAESAMLRKGAPLGMATSLLEATQQALRRSCLSHAFPAILAGEVTREAMFRALSGHGLSHEGASRGTESTNGHTSRPTVLLATELGSVISPRAFSTGFVEVLTDLWECPAHRQYLTKNAGIDEVWDAYISIIGATTPQWIQRRTIEAGIDEGFLGRFTLVYGHQRHKKKPTPKLRKDAEQIYERLIQRLYATSLLRGPAHLSPEAQEYYESWYGQLPDRPKDPRVDVGTLGRIHTTLLKTALLLHLGRTATLQIERQDVEDAARLISDLEARREAIFYGAAFADESPGVRHIEARLREAGKWISRSELLGGIYRFYEGTQEIDDNISLLIDSAQIQTKQERKGSRGPKTTYYRWRGKESSDEA